jgi:hypothetical protein
MGEKFFLLLNRKNLIFEECITIYPSLCVQKKTKFDDTILEYIECVNL